MFAILQKKSRYKKYENIALLVDNEDHNFTVAYHYSETENSKCFGRTPNENVFRYTGEQSKLMALKNAIAKYESIRI